MGIGYVKYMHSNVINLNDENDKESKTADETKIYGAIEQECIQFVPINDSCKVSIIKLKNNSNQKVKLKIRYDLSLQMGEFKRDSRFVRKNYKKGLNMITFNNIKNPWYLTYLSCSEKVGEDEEVEIDLNCDEDKTIVYVFGAEENEMNAVEIATKYLTNYQTELENTKKYWKELTRKS